MTGDARERETALDPTRSFIVEAPAGSGKTSILVQRFLRLLSGVDQPESVVAMTFTRKAATDMKQRVVDALTEAASGAAPDAEDSYRRKTFDLAQAALKRDREKGWNLRDDPNRLQVQTIDSLCALLTRQMPVISGFGGVNEVIEEASELFLRAVRETLTSLAEGTSEGAALFGRMVLHFDNDVGTLERHLVTMLSKRDQWEHLTGGSDDQLVQDCCVLLKLAEVQLTSVFQRAGQVDFTEIARAARLALGQPERPSDLLYALDYRFQHLLVDEFQDTSRAQYDLIEALTEQWSLGDDHTLFLVGDPMQSIYRFREADVSLFLRCWSQEQLGAVRLTPLRLTTNFRTTSAILDWIQTRFDPMMPADDAVKGAVKFRRSWSGREADGEAPELIPFVEDKGGEEARQIVQIIQADPERQVAILLRSRTHAAAILNALRSAEIHFEAIDIEALREQQHVIDVLSLTRALINVADRVSWLACLRAPWCGLTLEALSAIAEGKREDSILDLISRPQTMSGLAVEERWRLARTQEVLARAVNLVGRRPLRQLVEETWRQLGGLAATPANNQREDVTTLLRLIEESEEGGVIRDFSLLNKRLEFLYARPSAIPGAKVSVMTIHQAKGLEFDTVILPQIGAKPKSSDRELLVWTEQQQPDGTSALLVAALPQIGEEEARYEEISDAAKQKESHEVSRLFYVGATRAVNRLFITGNVSTKQHGAQCSNPPTGCFLKLIWDLEQPAFDKRRVLQACQSQVQFPFGAKAKGVPLRRLPQEWNAPVLARAAAPELVLRRSVPSDRPISYHWVGDTSRHTGTVVHDLFKRIAAEGVDEWSEARVLNLRSLVGSELLRLGVPYGEEPAAAKQVLRAVLNTLNSRRGRWILSAHSEARSEWPITGLAGGGVVSGTVDRFFKDESGRHWIVDFKTGQHSGGSLPKFLAAEKARYQPQLDQYAALASSLVNADIHLGLYFPLLDEWMEWRFAETAAAVS